jgi:outer membrane protein assembly factor BamD
MIGYCYYLDSPDPRLDQTATINALAAFQEFIDIYPESERVPEANKLMDELNNKLSKKAYLNAKLYYNLGNYMGNNYLSAVITAQNALKKFPSTSYREDLIMLILNSKYEEAIQSIEEKKIERYRNAIDEYYNYINEFPTGKYRKEADRIFNDSKKNVKE